MRAGPRRCAEGPGGGPGHGGVCRHPHFFRLPAALVPGLGVSSKVFQRWWLWTLTQGLGGFSGLPAARHTAEPIVHF